jgi:stage II sporulation SpoE-like protein
MISAIHWLQSAREQRCWLCELTARAHFATLFWGVYDRANGTLRYVNAGHAAPMLMRRSKPNSRLFWETGHRPFLAARKIGIEWH